MFALQPGMINVTIETTVGNYTGRLFLSDPYFSLHNKSLSMQKRGDYTGMRGTSGFLLCPPQALKLEVKMSGRNIPG